MPNNIQPSFPAFVGFRDGAVEPRGGPGSTSSNPASASFKALNKLPAEIWQFHPAGHPMKADLAGSSGCLNSFACFLIPAMVDSSGVLSTRYFGTQNPSSPPSESDLTAILNRFSSTPLRSASAKEFVQSSGAISGSPFSIIEVPVGMVSPGTTSTSQP